MLDWLLSNQQTISWLLSLAHKIWKPGRAGAANKHSNSWQMQRNVKATVGRGSECQILSELLLLVSNIFLLIHYCSIFLGTTPHNLHLCMRNILSLGVYAEETGSFKTHIHLLSPPIFCMNWAAVVHSLRMERLPRFPQKQGTTSGNILSLAISFKIRAFFKQSMSM